MEYQKIEKAKRSATCKLMKAAVESLAEMFASNREGAPDVNISIVCKKGIQPEYQMMITWPNNEVDSISSNSEEVSKESLSNTP